MYNVLHRAFKFTLILDTGSRMLLTVSELIFGPVTLVEIYPAEPNP